MSRPRSGIKSLLAGRIRPSRRPPDGESDRGSGVTLRISRVDDAMAGPNTHSRSPQTEQFTHVDALEGLFLAEAAIERIQTHLMTLDEQWRLVERVWVAADAGRKESEAVSAVLKDADEYVGPETSRGRMNYSGLDRIQLEIDSGIRSIDLVARAAVSDGLRLLDGSYRIHAERSAHGASASMTLPLLSSSQLGGERFGGFVSSLVTDGDNDARTGRVASARAIIRCAMLQCDGALESIRAFGQDVSAISHIAGDVADENAAAAQTARFDVPLIQQVGGISPVDALIAGRASSDARAVRDFFSPPGVRITSDADGPTSDKKS